VRLSPSDLPVVLEVPKPPRPWQLRSLECERVDDALLELMLVSISGRLLDDEAEGDVVGGRVRHWLPGAKVSGCAAAKRRVSIGRVEVDRLARSNQCM
jgi:hypothetical protein